jgi:hypothetical protein
LSKRNKQLVKFVREYRNVLINHRQTDDYQKDAMLFTDKKTIKKIRKIEEALNCKKEFGR